MTRDLLSNSLDFGRLESQKSCFSLGGSTISEKSTFSKKCRESHFSAPFWLPNSARIGKKSVPKMSQFFESFLEAFFYDSGLKWAPRRAPKLVYNSGATQFWGSPGPPWGTSGVFARFFTDFRRNFTYF